jgi:3-hydroxy-D-aspartate aldolase
MDYVARIPRGQVRTPALLVDLDVLDANIAAMAARAREWGVGLRPHAKAHKCIAIARRLSAAGAMGTSCATVGEAESLFAGGIAGILITSPIATTEAFERIRLLVFRSADVRVVVDHPAQVEHLAALGLRTDRDRRLPVLVDVDVGNGRTGCRKISDALALAQRIAHCSALRFAGVQAYWGHLQQIANFEERRRRVQAEAQKLAGLIKMLTENGLKPEIVTGGGTGTHWIDAKTGLFTEVQPGSFIFLDSCYAPLQLSPEPSPFRRALSVATAVISANHPNRVIVDAGFKALATDSGKPVPVRGAPEGATYRFFGDEHGAIEFTTGDRPALGSVIELLPSHCDPTVNLYNRYLVVQGEAVVDEWPIVARGY